MGVFCNEEVLIMKEKMILLGSVDAAKEFVALASKCDFDVDVSVGKRIAIDGKSIVGVMSLNLLSPVNVSYCGEDKDFEAFLEKHEQLGHTAA